MREAFNDAMVTGGQELEPGILLPDEKARSAPSSKSRLTGRTHQRDGTRGARWHHEATFPSTSRNSRP